MRASSRLCLAAVLAGCAALLFGQVRTAAQQTPEQSPSSRAIAQDDEGGRLRVTRESRGRVTFAVAEGRGTPSHANASATAEERAQAFLRAHGAELGLPGNSEMRAARSWRDATGREHVRLKQTHDGIPIAAAELIVHLDGPFVTGVNGETVGGKLPSPQPDIDAAVAAATARAAVEKSSPGIELTISGPRLEYLNESLLDDVSPDETQLTWFVEITGDALREFAWIDARSGRILLRFNQLPHAKYRRVFTANNTSTLPGTLLRVEGGPATGNAEANFAYQYAGDTYDYFFNTHGRDSYNRLGAILDSTVDYCPSVGPCPYANAFWNGHQMVYGVGMAAADDVVAHEITHAVTDNEANLFYYTQSGALNESFSDMFGETIDLLNGAGNDTAGVRWRMGEDSSLGSIRYMMDPTEDGHPGKMTDFQYECDPYYDGGGVHINSGVPNHAYALMVDGGTYNGLTVAPIGLDKAGKIAYRSLTTYLTSGSNFIDFWDAMLQSCQDLQGSGVTTGTDCYNMIQALEAVQIWYTPRCGGRAGWEQQMCPAGPTPQAPSAVFSDSFETGGMYWTAGSTSSTQWGIIGEYARTGLMSAWGDNPDYVSDHWMSMANSVVVPPNARLYFSHAYTFDHYGSAWYDGGVLEYSTDYGASWFDAGAMVASGETYRGYIQSGFLNPLANRFAFVGDSAGFTSTQLNLASLAGQPVRFRWRVGTDNSIFDLGWVVDDVQLYTCCTFTVSNAVLRLPGAGGSATLYISPSTSWCNWRVGGAMSPWLSATPLSGTGAGTVTFTAEPNPSASTRSSFLTVGGKSVEVRQGARITATVTPSVPSPQKPNTSITLTGSGSGGTTPYRYKFWLWNGSTWSVLREWDFDPVFVWTPNAENPNYRIGLWVQSIDGSTGADGTVSLDYPIQIPPLTLSLGADLPNPPARPPGTTVTFTATAGGGTESYEFKWLLFDGTTWTPQGTWGTQNTFAWTPLTPNPNYRVGVWLRNTGAPDAAQKAASMVYPIAGVSSIAIAPSAASPQPPNTPITFTATPTGGGAPQQVRWYVFDGAAWTMVKDWHADATYTWTPTLNGSYTIGAWARSASNPTNTAEATASLPFTIAAPRVNSVALGSDVPTPQEVGTTITFTATPSGGSAPQQFKYWLFNGTAWTMVRDWNVDATWGWTPETAGNYSVGVWARSAGAAADAPAEATTSMPFVVNPRPRMTGAAVTPDVGAPQPPGTTITLTASGAGGVTPYEYKFLLFDGAAWAVLRDWHTNPVYAWTPLTANSAYRIGVWARSAGNSANAAEAAASIPYAIQIPPVASVALDVSPVSPQYTGTTLTLTATPTGGVGPVQYRFYVFDGTAWTMMRDWAVANTFDWTPMTAGSYMLGVWARSAGSTSSGPEATRSIAFVVNPRPRVTSATIDTTPDSPQAPNTAITITATGVGGLAPLEYKFLMFNGTAWSEFQAWGTSNSVPWMPLAVNPNIRIGVWVRSAGNTADAAEAAASMPFAVVNPPVTAVSFTTTPGSPQAVNTPVTIQASATGGVGPVQYRFWVFNGTTWTMVRDWGTDPNFVWTPTAAGNYTLGVWAKSADSVATGAEAIVSQPFVINP